MTKNITIRLFLYDLEKIMKQALATAGLVVIVVFLGGIIFGWEYALFLAFVILLGVSLIAMVRK